MAKASTKPAAMKSSNRDKIIRPAQTATALDSDTTLADGVRGSVRDFNAALTELQGLFRDMCEAHSQASKAGLECEFRSLNKGLFLPDIVPIEVLKIARPL